MTSVDREFGPLLPIIVKHLATQPDRAQDALIDLRRQNMAFIANNPDFVGLTPQFSPMAKLTKSRHDAAKVSQREQSGAPMTQPDRHMNRIDEIEAFLKTQHETEDNIKKLQPMIMELNQLKKDQMKAGNYDPETEMKRDTRSPEQRLRDAKRDLLPQK